MKTRCGSLASRAARSNSRPASGTGDAPTRTWRARRSTTSSPTSSTSAGPAGGSPQHRTDPRHELGVELALGDVVGAALEGAHALDRVGARGREHDHRDVAIPAPAGLALAQARAQLRLAREHDVGPRPLCDVERLRAPAGLDARRSRPSSGCARDSPGSCGSGSARRRAARMASKARAGRSAADQMSFRPDV